MKKHKLLIVTLFLSGCATAINIPEVAKEGQPYALVKGVGMTAGSFFSGMLNPFDVQQKIHIVKVNGKRLMSSGSVDEVKLVPGSYSLGVECTIRFSSQYVEHSADLKVSVLAGHIYQLAAKMNEDDCDATIKDITNEKAKS